MPAAEIVVPSFGLINYLFSINYPRLIVIFILLPALFLFKRSHSAPFGKLIADRFLLALSALMVVLQLRETTLTDTLRQGLYILLDVLIPYFIISRSLRDTHSLRAAIAAYFVAAFLLAGFAAFEISRHWNLYSALVSALDLSMGFGSYLGRDGLLRASASTGHSIALGFVMTVAIGLFLFLQASIRGKWIRLLAWGGLIIGLLAPLSRGPWVGVVIVFVFFIITGQAAIRKLATLAIAGVVSLPLLIAIPGGERIVNLLPFVGTVDKSNIDYRERLIEKAWIVIQRNPMLGSANYRSTPEMESMRQGQGIIDIVNTYIGITLEYGLVGLALFVGFFLTILYGVFKAQRSIKTSDQELHQLGRALFATLAGILFIIFTVSSITIIPIVYWSIAGLCMAYIQLVRVKIINKRTLSPT